MEREGIPDVGLFIEQATDRTPDRVKFHIFHGDELIASCASKKKAKQIYRNLLSTIGYVPPRPAASVSAETSAIDRERLQRSLDASEDYWGSSSLYRKHGRYR